MTPLQVAVIHHEPMVAEGIAAALARQPHIELVGVATTAAEAQGYATRVDAVVIDERLPGADLLAAGLGGAGVWIVLLGDGRDAPARGARISTRSSISSLASALGHDKGNASRASGPKRLSSREQEILELVAQGMVGKQVAHRLGISPKTVEQHKARIFAKLGVPNQTAAVSAVLTKRGEPGP